VEVSHVRRRLKAAMEAARERTQRRRQRTTEAEQAFEAFLANVAVPVVRQIANALKAEGYNFTVFTPSGALRLASDKGRDDFIEIALDNAGDEPQVVARISHVRGSRTLDEERPLKPGVPPEALTEDDVLEFLAGALEPWFER